MQRGGAGAGLNPRDHLRHAWCSHRGLCVPDFLHAELRARLVLSDESLRAWYDQIVAAIPDTQPIPEDAVTFWRRQATRPPSPPRVWSGPTVRFGGVCCYHRPGCSSLTAHLTKAVQDREATP